MTTSSTINALLTYEMDPNSPSDGRNVIRNLRMQIEATLQTGGDVGPLVRRARDVLEMWREVAPNPLYDGRGH